MDKDLHTMEELKTKVYGKIGTPKRDKIENILKEFTDELENLNQEERESYLKKVLEEDL